MAQTLYIKMPDGTRRTVNIIRSFGDIGGKQVFYHADGRYAWKDGSPLKSAGDLDIIAPGVHREHALAWWKRAGAAESKAYYEALEAKALAEAGDFRPELDDSSALDAVLYTRRATKKGAAVSAPKAWPEWFPKRPDWWGQAQMISFGDFVYHIQEPTEPENPEA